MDDMSLLANPGETFFQHGYKEGYAHGRIHGLIEGRALGKEKGLEIWEEVGYYKGFASFWNSALGKSSKESDSLRRARNHIKFILSAIDRFPMVNPSSATDSSTDPLLLESQVETVDRPVVTQASASDSPNETQQADSVVDIMKLLTLIRSRHRALCSILGVKPRLVVGGVKDASDQSDSEITDHTSAEGSSIVRKKGKSSLWKLDTPEKPPSLDY